jgi:signal transduction histidine kinase
VNGNLVRIWVEDNGVGIDPSQHERLFKMFERLNPKDGYEGTGIGLAIVRKAVDKMGGNVGVESDGKSGSQFWIELPNPSPTPWVFRWRSEGLWGGRIDRPKDAGGRWPFL